MVELGRLGIDLTREILISQDPAYQTGVGAGSKPLLAPLKDGPTGNRDLAGLAITSEY